MALLLDNAHVFSFGKLQKQNIILDEYVRASGKEEVVLPLLNYWVLPGLIDVHVHFRVPGGEHKEDWKSGSKAAAHGGVTMVIDMPNTHPPTTTKKLFEEKKTIAERDSIVRHAFHFGATADNFNEALSIPDLHSVKMYMGSSTGNLLVNNKEVWEKWFQLCKQKNWVMVVHAEDENLIQEHTKTFTQNDVHVHNKIRDSHVEEMAVQNALELQKKIGNKLHIAHLSTKAGLELIEKAKGESSNVTCEVSPHHLFLSEKDLDALGNGGKMNPSLKTKGDVHALWKGLREGTIDCIATDHAPHTIEEKNKPYLEAPSGVPGIETMLPLVLDAVHREDISLERVVECCSTNPARIFNYPYQGGLEPGKWGDAIVIDPNAKWTIHGKELFSKCGWTPFEGKTIYGKVIKTIVGGKIVYDERQK
jgi:dihydroorotase (multifunctional complex type)